MLNFSRCDRTLINPLCGKEALKKEF